MRDGPLRATVKFVSRLVFTAAVAMRRARLRRRGEEKWVLAGTCGGCAKCCEEPTLQVDRLTFHFPRLRRLFLWWQREVNGFEFTGEERRLRLFTFRCTHFDPVTRKCDSYATRPGICRDYPRELLWQAWPEFLEGCGYRPIAKNGASMLVELRTRGVSEEKIDEIATKLRLR